MPDTLDGPSSDPTLEAIVSRRTTRRFDPARPLPDPLLARLLGLATLAPSPMNLQPWRFVVVRDLRIRQKLRACTFGESRLTDAPVALIVLAYLHPDRVDLPEVLDRMLALEAIGPDDAPKFRATATREWGRGDGPTLRATRASMLAVGTLMIAAEAEGVASCWLEGFDEEKVREAFGIPDDHAICGLIALGYAAEPAPFPGRLDLDRVCFAEHFGRPWHPGEPSD
jgi:nitroreductase